MNCQNFRYRLTKIGGKLNSVAMCTLTGIATLLLHGNAAMATPVVYYQTLVDGADYFQSAVSAYSKDKISTFVETPLLGIKQGNSWVVDGITITSSNGSTRAIDNDYIARAPSLLAAGKTTGSGINISVGAGQLVGQGLTYTFANPINSFGVQLGDWGTCCYPSSMYIQFGLLEDDSWGPEQLVGTAKNMSDVPEHNLSGNTFTFIGAINDTGFFDRVRIYGDGVGEYLIAGGTIFSGLVELDSVPQGAGSVFGAIKVTDIDTDKPYYLASNLGGTVNPVFVGGILENNKSVITQDFTIDDSVAGPSSTIDQNGKTMEFQGVLADAPGKQGSITISNGATGGGVVFENRNTYTGSTTITNSADLKLAGIGSIEQSAGVIDHGVFDISGIQADAARITTLSGDGLVTLGSKTLELTQASGNFTGVIDGSGGFALDAGTEVLSGNNTYTGNTVLNGGTLQVAADANMGNAGALILNGGNLHTTSSFSSSRQISLQTGSDSSITTDDNTTLQVSGVISGAGNLLKNGSGTLAVSGANPGFSGQTTINNGTISIDQGTSLGNGQLFIDNGTLQTTRTLNNTQQIRIGNHAVINTDAGTVASFAGDMSGGTGCLGKSGLGALNLQGSASLAGGVCVEQGVLRANGALSGNVSVDETAMLTGAGTINGVTTIQGTLVPGNNLGVLHSTGSVNMASGSRYEANIDGRGTGTGAGNYSQLILTGKQSQFVANGSLYPVLRGITVDPDQPNTRASNDFTPVIGDNFRIIQAEGGIDGRFSSVVQPAQGLAPDTQLLAFYNDGGSNSIDLRLLPTSYSRLIGGTNRNAMAVAGVLDKIMAGQMLGTTNSAQGGLLSAISTQNVAALQGTMRLLAGSLHGAMAAASVQSAQGVQTDVSNHLQDGNAAGIDVDPARLVWGNVSVEHQQISSNQIASGYKSDRTQVTIGVDLHASQQNLLGLGFSHAETRVTDESGKGSLHENLVFAYGTQAIDRFFVDGVIAYGLNDWTTSRRDALQKDRSLLASASGNNLLLSSRLRLPIVMEEMRIEPFAQVIWQRGERGAEDEGAASSALSLPSHSVEGTRSMLGITARSLQQDPLKSPYTYALSLAVGVDEGQLAQAKVDSWLAGDALTIRSADSGRQFVQTQLAGTARIGKQAYVYGKLNSEIARNRDAYGATVGLRIAF